MALKSDRSTLQTDISFFMNEAATRGGVATLSAGGSGASMDNGTAIVTYDATPSGAVAQGLLLNDMVDIDLLAWRAVKNRNTLLVDSFPLKIKMATLKYSLIFLTLTLN